MIMGFLGRCEVPVTIRNAVIHTGGRRIWMEGGSITNNSGSMASIMPYGVLLPPFCTYQVPAMLLCPIEILRVPNDDAATAPPRAVKEIVK